MQLSRDDLLLGERSSLVAYDAEDADDGGGERRQGAAAAWQRPLGRVRPAPLQRPRTCAVLVLLPVVVAGFLLTLVYARLQVAHGDDSQSSHRTGVARPRGNFFQLFDIAGGNVAKTSQHQGRLRHHRGEAAQTEDAVWESQQDLNCWVGKGSSKHRCCDDAGEAVADMRACQASCLGVQGCNCVTYKEGQCWLRHNCTFRTCVEADGFASARTTTRTRADLPIPLVPPLAPQTSDEAATVFVASAGPADHPGAQKCHTATEGERCYEHVIWAMTVGFKRDPSKYEGLSTTSTVDDFQAVLHDDPDKHCPRPCGSALAIFERSADAVAEHLLASSTQGPASNHGGSLRTTEPYKGSETTEPSETSEPAVTTAQGSDSDPSTTESSLAGATSSAGASTAAPLPPSGVSLFCWSVYLAGGNEMALLQSQKDRHASIFACDGYLVFLNDPDGTFSVSDPNVVRLDTKPVPKGEPWKGHTTDSWLNTETFMLAWDSLLKDGRFRKETWVAKVDPDCVFFPERLVNVLLGHAGREQEKSYLLNCYRVYGDDDGRPAKLFGSLEVVSTVAMEAFLQNLETCKKDLQWSGWGEDFFMQSCLETVGAIGVEEFDMMRDRNCKEVEDPCNHGGKVAFHHFKDSESYEGCLEESKGAARAWLDAQEERFRGEDDSQE